MGYESYFEDDVPDFIREAEEMIAQGETIEAPAEVTIKFGKGLVGDPFTSKNGKELVEVLIPNRDPADTRPWGCQRRCSFCVTIRLKAWNS